MVKAPFGRAGLGGAAIALALALFVLASGLRGRDWKWLTFKEKFGGKHHPDAVLPGNEKRPVLPGGEEPAQPNNLPPDKPKDPPPDEPEDPPHGKKKDPPPDDKKDSEPQTKLDQAPTEGAASGDGGGPHPPPIPWDAGALEAESGLRLRAASGPGSTALSEDAVARLKALLGDGADPAFFESGALAVRYVEAGRYDGEPRRPGGAAPKAESGGYMLLGVRSKMRYLLLLPDGARSLRVLKLGPDGKYEIER